MTDGSITVPIELLVLFDFFAIGLAWWSGRESGQAKEQRLRRVAVDDAFKRGKQAGWQFMDVIRDAKTERMSGVAVGQVVPSLAKPYDWGTAVELFDFEKEMEA